MTDDPNHSTGPAFTAARLIEIREKMATNYRRSVPLEQWVHEDLRIFYGDPDAEPPRGTLQVKPGT